MKRVLFGLAVCSMLLVGSSTASAQAIYGPGGHYHGGYTRGHYDYHPGGLVRHGHHFDYIPGHFDYHRGGHGSYFGGGYAMPMSPFGGYALPRYGHGGYAPRYGNYSHHHHHHHH